MRDEEPIPDLAKAPMRRRTRRLTALQVAVLAGSLVIGLTVGSLRQQPDRRPGAVAVQAPGMQGVAPAATQSRLKREFRLAGFDAQPSADVLHVAHWVVDSGDNRGKAIVIVDKKDARVWVLDPHGGYVSDTPALLGAAVGDDPVPGIGDKPLSEVLPEEKTTPAGRYDAELGQNAGQEDVVWVSWDLAVSLHRVRPTVQAEQRLERLASATSADNRISFGCINLPPAFYEQVLRPMVEAMGAVVYVLPETRTPQEQFGSYAVAQRPRLTLSSMLAVK